MVDTDIIFLDPILDATSSAPVSGMSTAFENDPGRRSAYDISRGGRRSLSQPVQEEKRSQVAQSTQARALISPRKNRVYNAQSSVPNEFFGVYCLISRSQFKHYKNRCYIGYTVDPNRRIRQHNGGRDRGGAKKTDNRGPWDMVCIIHGFPNSVAALRFEWAWQNPEASRITKGLVLKKSRKETPFAYRLRVACHLLNCRPFDRFALTFRWLLPSEELPFPEDALPPQHILKKYGLIKKSVTAVPSGRDCYVEKGLCSLCGCNIDKLVQLVRCPSCTVHFHAKCLAANGLKGEGRMLYPAHGTCPRCCASYLWGEIIRDQRVFLKISEAQVDISLKSLVPRMVKD